jgi:acyl-CoA thioesterase
MKHLKTDSADIYTGPHQIELESWISCAPFEKYLGIEVIKAKEGKAVLTMPFTFNLAQGAGLMHGGAIVTLADTAVAMAIKSSVSSKSRFGTIKLTSEFLAPVTKGLLTAKAGIKFLEDRMIQGKATVLDENKKEVMKFSAMFKLAKDAEILR